MKPDARYPEPAGEHLVLVKGPVLGARVRRMPLLRLYQNARLLSNQARNTVLQADTRQTRIVFIFLIVTVQIRHQFTCQLNLRLPGQRANGISPEEYRIVGA